MRIFVAHASGFDFREKLYAPLQSSALHGKHEFIFPQEGTEILTKDAIKEADVFMIDASMPSTGAGIELGWADAFGKRIICVHETGTAVSHSVAFVTDTIIEYSSGEELIEKLSAAIAQV